MLKDEIIAMSKQKPFRVYFDMDGVLCEERAGESARIKANEKDIYFKKRPIKSVLKVAKELFDEGVEVCILSSCGYMEQTEQKRKWLKIYAPFIEEKNEHFVVYSKILFTEEEKPFLKARKLVQLTKDFEGEFMLIEDRHANINATNTHFGRKVAEHVSCFID